ncbi:MAG: hypothetical protein L7H21_02605 [Sulfolobales archaeon]|nr:hypothetical protein [Sulfolobales archaeon]MCG2894147.1 hypothetical protein [Sulfolobales archaeon]MCG2910518.1 hypothetical protein [Sulfolobales archaeon]
MSSKFADYVNAVLTLENGLKSKEFEVSEMGKRLLLLANDLSNAIAKEAEKKLQEIYSMIDKEINEELEKLRANYEARKKEEISLVDGAAQRNFDRAVDFLVSKVIEVLKS